MKTTITIHSNNSFLSIKRFLLIAFILLGPSSSSLLAQDSNNADLSVNIEIDSSVHQVGGKINVTYTVKNNGKQGVQVLKWGTPLEGSNCNFLRVIFGKAEKLKFRGLHINHGSLSADDYVLIKPGKTVERKINIDDLWDFNKTGTYSLLFEGSFLDVVQEPNEPSYKIMQLNKKSYISKVLAFKMVGKSRMPSDPNIENKTKGLVYNDCNTSEEATLKSTVKALQDAWPNCKEKVFKAMATKERWNSDAYISTFFGKFNWKKRSKLTKIFHKIDTIITNGDFTFYCGEPNFDNCLNIAGLCEKEDGRAASSCPGGTKMQVCEHFFDFHLDYYGIYDQTQMNLLFHEIVHMAGVPFDYAYGCTDCSKLNEAEQLDNAANYTYLMAYYHHGGKACGIDNRFLITLLIVALFGMVKYFGSGSNRWMNWPKRLYH